MDLIAKLGNILGKDMLISKEEAEAFANDHSQFNGTIPIAVVMPRNAKQISKVMELCSKENVHVTVRGAGSSLTGASTSVGKCIIIEMSHFNHIIETKIEDGYVIAEPNVKIDQLNKHLAKYNCVYPPDPASSSMATIGGTISTNAGGLRAVKYGTTKQWVLGLEVVLPTGKIIRTGGRVLKRSIGYDLTALMVASEGTLGIITKATLAIWPRPEAVAMVIGYFSSIEGAARATVKMKVGGIIPLAAEFIDKESMRLMQEYKHIKFPDNANYMLFIEVGTTKESVRRVSNMVEKIMLGSNALDTDRAVSKHAIEELYQARKYLFNASKAKAAKSKREVIIADTVVPASKLPVALHQMKHVTSNCGLEVVMFGHIGDGNIHANILYRKDNNVDEKSVDKLQHDLARIAIKHGGSVSGEHGIGLGKKEMLKEEFKARDTLENLVLMKKIKQVFDPKAILNPGKIFD